MTLDPDPSRNTNPPPPHQHPAAAAAQALWTQVPRVLLRSIVFLFFLWVARAWLVPVALGGVFAILLTPWNKRLARTKTLKNIAPLVLTVGSLILVILPLALLATVALSSISEFLSSTSTSPEEVQQTAVRKLLPVLREMNFGSGRSRAMLRELFEKLSSYGAELATGMVSEFPNFVIEMFLLVVSLFYFLRDGSAIAAWLMRRLPFRQSETEELYSSIRDTVNGALLGTIATAVVQGVLVTVAFLALDVPGAFLFGIVAAILSFTPVLGTAPVTMGGVLYLVLEARWVPAMVMFAAGIFIGASDNIVRPWVTSSKGNLHPLLGLVGIFGGISVFGPFGIFLGPVTAAMAIWTLDTYGNLRRAQAERAESGVIDRPTT